MVYDPLAPTGRERIAAYFVTWLGLAASLLVTVCTLWPLSDGLRGLAAGVVGFEMMVFVFGRRFDSYFRQLRDFGAVTGLAVVALWLAATGLAQVGQVAHAMGFALGSHGPTAPTAGFTLPGWLSDPWLITGLAAVGFHAGFLFAHFRGPR